MCSIKYSLKGARYKCPYRSMSFEFEHFCSLFVIYLYLSRDGLLMRPESLLTNEQERREFSLSILSVSITLAYLLGSPSFSICFVPRVHRRLDGRSMGWAFEAPHNGLSVSAFFILSLFHLFHDLSSSLCDSFSRGGRRHTLLKRAEAQRQTETE